VWRYCVTPTGTSLRGVQQLRTRAKGQPCWGIRRTALGALSEAAPVFDAALRQGDLAWLRDWVAREGSLLPARPRRGWAVGQDAQQRAAKRHGAFAALRPVPVGVTVTPGNGAERAPARPLGHPGGF
jgi:hypothetical protein